MAKSFCKNKIKLVAATSLAIFTLFSAFVGSFAWYTGMRARNNNNNNMVVKDPTLILNNGVVMHPFYTDSSHVLSDDNLYFNMNATATDLGRYNPLELGYQTILEIKLTDYGKSLNNLILSVTSTATHYLARNNPQGEFVRLAYTGNSLSSVMDFTYFNDSNLTADPSVSGVYKLTKSTISANTKTFINSDGSLTSTIILGSNLSFTNGHFYILLDYNAIRVNEIYAANLGNPVCSGEIPYVDYTPDFTFKVAEGPRS